MIKINNFRGDPSDTSSEKTALVATLLKVNGQCRLQAAERELQREVEQHEATRLLLDEALEEAMAMQVQVDSQQSEHTTLVAHLQEHAMSAAGAHSKAFSRLQVCITPGSVHTVRPQNILTKHGLNKMLFESVVVPNLKQ